MRILALDLGMKTGWALGDKGTDPENVHSGTQLFALKRGESPGMRYLRFDMWLTEFIVQHNPTFIVYEQVHHRGGHATEVLGAFKGILQKCCARHNIEFVPVHSGTLKKFATGSGVASKEDMMRTASLVFGKPVLSGDDEADALHLWKMASEGEV